MTRDNAYRIAYLASIGDPKIMVFVKRIHDKWMDGPGDGLTYEITLEPIQKNGEHPVDRRGMQDADAIFRAGTWIKIRQGEEHLERLLGHVVLNYTDAKEISALGVRMADKAKALADERGLAPELGGL